MNDAGPDMPERTESTGARRRALITGITGQDGSYLAELLLSKGYDVWGMIRRSSSFNTGRIDHLYQDPHDHDVRLHLVYGDLNDASSLNHILRQVRPDEVYNLGAQSHVRVSFDVPEYTAEITALGTVRLLEAIREVGIDCKFYQASSSELYGKVVETPQTEQTPFYPRSPYAAAKAYSFHITVNYREAYGLFACNGILFNHESPAAWRDVRHAQDHACRRTNQSRVARQAVLGQPRCQTGLGFRRRLRRGDVVDAASRRARRLRRGDW